MEHQYKYLQTGIKYKICLYYNYSDANKIVITG